MTALFPTAYLPPISYVARCMEADEILIEVWETYPKQTLRNHCDIGGPNGRQRLTIPVNKSHGNHTRTKDIRIASNLPWQKIHWRSFETAYNKSPFFLYYQDYFLPFYEKDFTFLLDFNMQLLETLFLAIRFDKTIGTTPLYETVPNGTNDLRNQWTVGCGQNAVDGGQEWLRAGGRGLTVTRQPEYYQVFGDRNGFLADLTIVDLLFNLGPEANSYLLSL